MSYYIGIDIGSSSSKTVILDDSQIIDYFIIPTGYNGKETATKIHNILEEKGYLNDSKIVASGYGRVCVDWADKILTEITCHGKGAYELFKSNCTVIDVGGQDTKIINIEDGLVKDFLMNDKCAAGTGKFIEVMATRLGASLDEFFNLSSQGEPLAINSMCTVFAESEVISHIGQGEKREDIAAGVVHSIVKRVEQMCKQQGLENEVVLTGGLSNCSYFIEVLSQKLNKKVRNDSMGQYAGALGGALYAKRIK
jgi:predicted CoA-substrate-specific enzyme activase